MLEQHTIAQSAIAIDLSLHFASTQAGTAPLLNLKNIKPVISYQLPVLTAYGVA